MIDNGTVPVINPSDEPVRIGAVYCIFGDLCILFDGLIDDVSICNRALSSNEVAALYAAGSAGMCKNGPPNITLQPQSQSVVWSLNATFTVAATGTRPLAYQWQFQGANLPADTNAALTVASVGTNQVGNYRVIITNSAGAATSSVAVLTGTVGPGYWTGGGDGVSWNNAANWSSGVVPGPTNDVVITGVGTNVIIILASSVTVQSLQCSASLNVSGGDLSLTKGPSGVAGNFTVGAGRSLNVSGTNTTFTASGPTVADRADASKFAQFSQGFFTIKF